MTTKKVIKKINSCIKTVDVKTLIQQERLDAKKIIKDGIAGLPPDEVAYDENFRRDLGISKQRWQDHANDSQFDDFKARLPNRKLVWGNKKTIDALKQWDGVL